VTGDRQLALTALYARAVERSAASVTRARVLHAERAVIALRFGGSESAYRSALAAGGATVEVGREVIADQLRHALVEDQLPVRRPTAAEVGAFYRSYPELLARRVRAVPAPRWLGGRKEGIALSSLAPEQIFKLATGRVALVRDLEGTYRVRVLAEPMQLGALPLGRARPAITTALVEFGRGTAFQHWTAARQTDALRRTTCLRDDMPAPGAVDLATFLPFLSLTGA
jgi:hypothetical protein